MVGTIHSGGNRIVESPLAVFFAGLMVLSIVAGPVLASSATSTQVDKQLQAGVDLGDLEDSIQESPSNESSDDNESDGEQEETTASQSGSNSGPDSPYEIAIPEFDGTFTIELLANARDQIAALDPQRGSGERHQEDAIEAINASIEEYRAGLFANSKDAFFSKKDAYTSLQPLANRGENREIVQEAQAKLATASNVSARLALRQAVSAVRDHEDSLSESQKNKVKQALKKSEKKLEHGNRARNPSVITHYRESWEESQRALDIIEKAVEPRLEAEYGPAIEQNGTYRTQVYLSLTDIRPFRHEKITLTLENGSTKTINTSNGQFANTNAAGVVEVDLGSEVTNQTATASATSQRQPIRGSCQGNDCERTVDKTFELTFTDSDIISERPDPDEFNEIKITDDESGVTVEAGGEGLYEKSISIQDRTLDEDSSFRAGPIVRIQNRTNIDSATVTIPINDAAQDKSNLSIYTWDPSDPEGWKRIDTEISPETGTAKAEVDHFSFFSVFQSAELEDRFTEVITLQDRHVQGTLGNESDSDPVKADFVFSIDTSGSMSGDKIRFARDAAKLFVGSLFEDEVAGLVAFDSSASVRQPLTTDHEALNESISNLGARGGTDLPDGIRRAARLISNEGFENRSNEVILLADGQTDTGDPVAAAERAAERNVTINTVGLTNAVNEETLREVASVAGGDFYLVEDPEDLPDTFERIANNQDVELIDSSGNGIPDAVAEANPRIPQAPAEFGIGGNPIRPRIDLDPTTIDTSGDGIPDAETIDVSYRVFTEDNETKLATRVTRAEHHPARIDTDFDGLSDKREINGWDVQYIPDRESVREYQSKLVGAEEPDYDALVGKYFETPQVDSNPFVRRTDADELDDEEEKDFGTHPRREDTTGDGIPDDVAATNDLNPTLYDNNPPEIEVEYWEWEKESLSFTTTYSVTATLRDQSGVALAELRKDGDTKSSKDLSGNVEVFYEDEFSEGGIFDPIIDGLSGTQVTVYAEDNNGNSARTAAIQRANLFGNAASLLASLGIEDRRLALYLGAFSGITTGAGETADAIRMFIEDPIAYIQALSEILDVIENIDKIPDAIERQQDLNNPFDEDDDPEQYESYREGWYTGYIVYFALELLVPGSELKKGVKTPNRLSDLADDVDNQRLRKAVEQVRRTQRAGAETISRTRYRAIETLSKSKDLSQNQVRKLLRFAKGTGPVQGTIRFTKKLDPRTTRAIADGSGNFDDAYDKVILRQRDNDAIDANQIDNVVKRIDDLNGVLKQRAKRLVAQTGEQGIKFVDEADPQGFRRVLDIEDSAKIGQQTARDARTVLVRSSFREDFSVSRVTRFVENLKEIESVKGSKRLVQRIANQRGSINGGFNTVKGTVFEARFAKAFGVNSITELEVPYKTRAGDEADIDVLQTDGKTIIFDAKAVRDPSPDEIGKQIEQYKRLKNNDVGDDVIDYNIPEDSEIVFVSRYSREEFFTVSNDAPNFLQSRMDDLKTRIENNPDIKVEPISKYE